MGFEVGTQPGAVVLVVGDGELAGALADAVGRAGGTARRLRTPTDGELADAVHAGPVRVAVVSHDDIVALRYALVAAHARPGVRLLVTIFDRTVATQIHRAVPNSHVVSLADAAIPSLAAACLSPELLAVQGDEALARSAEATATRASSPSPPSRAHVGVGHRCARSCIRPTPARSCSCSASPASSPCS